MNRIAFSCLALASLLAAAPAYAVTNDNGDILISQAAVNAGGITPGDTAGFPVTISVSGTYRLATNLTVTTEVNGIQVQANEVTIEMGGHTLAGSGVGRNGIASFNRNLKVQHGTVRGFTNDGIRSIAPLLAVDDVVIAANGRVGVFADDTDSDSAPFASVVESKVISNAYGIQCGANCRVENSLVSQSAHSGIYFTGPGGLALGNTVTSNGNFATQNAEYGISFFAPGGAGNNTVLLNKTGQINGAYIPMQPNACSPECPPPT